MKVQHTGERIKAAMDISNVAQNALAVETQLDPGAISRTLSQPDLDGWTAFLFGMAIGKIITKRHARQVSQG